MTPNLIERLREHRNDGGCDCRGCSRCEAANDLERLRALAIHTTKILNAIEVEIDGYLDGAPERGEAANLANNISSLLQGISLVHGGKL